MRASQFFTKDQKEEVMRAINSAEQDTSGEIRVHIERNCKIDPLERALEVFNHLKMDRTVQRNGVLIYLAVASHKLAIIGDEGINKVVPENFWDDVKSNMVACFKQSDYVKGVSSSILMVGQKLKEHFPFQHGDTNELSDEISFEDLEIQK